MSSTEILTFSLIFLISILTVAVVYDFVYKRIPNWLTFGGVVIGLVLASVSGGLTLPDSLLGLLVAFAIGWSFWAAGMVGGGDHKLLLVVGTFVGYPLILPVLLGIALAGGAQAVLWIIIKRQSWRGVPIPYSLAITVGTLVVLGLQKFYFFV